MNSFANFGSTLVAAGYLGDALRSNRACAASGLMGSRMVTLVIGYVRDPRVGRDVLIGCVFAVLMTLPEIAYGLLPQRLGYPPAIPRFQDGVSTLSGFSELALKVFDNAVGGVFVAMFAAFGFVLMRLIFRRQTPAIVAWVVVLSMFQATQVLTSGTSLWIAAAFQVCMIALLTIMIVRYGLLVTAVAFAVGSLLEDIPLTLSLSHWTATTSNLALATALAITCFGFYAARAGQPLFGKYEG
jgi:hypothetical protein